MKKNNVLVFDVEDLPAKIELRNREGKTKEYVLSAAGRKFGACLQALQIQDQRTNS